MPLNPTIDHTHICIYIYAVDTSGVNLLASQICHNRLFHKKLQQSRLHMISTEVSSFATHNAGRSTKFLLMLFARNEQIMSTTLAWTIRICKAEPAKKRTVHRERELLTETTRNYSCTTHQWKKEAPQSMQTAIKKVKMECLAQRAIGSEKSAICLLITSQSR
jgi:hypothetical protein